MAKVVVTFSGGHDEGGIDGITFEDFDTGLISLPEIHWSDAYLMYPSDNWEPPIDLTDNQELSQLLQGPVDAEFGSWAGEWSVNGDVVWNVTDGTVIMTKNESVETYTTHTAEF